MLTPTERLIYQHLGQFVSEHKKHGVEKILEHRTRYLTVVLEDIFQSQNASAAIRTCECMGLQDIHMVENISKYSVNPKVLRGSNKWVDIHHYKTMKKHNTTGCMEKLKAEGYTVVVTAPDPDGISIHDIEVRDSKIALLFGNELRGVSREALRYADQKITIPMYGFTESYNISVSVAICLSVVMTKLRESKIDWGLSGDEKDQLRLRWYRKIVRKSSLIESEYLRTID